MNNGMAQSYESSRVILNDSEIPIEFESRVAMEWNQSIREGLGLGLDIRTFADVYYRMIE